jgi:hypothetical protein
MFEGERSTFNLLHRFRRSTIPVVYGRERRFDDLTGDGLMGSNFNVSNTKLVDKLAEKKV